MSEEKKFDTSKFIQVANREVGYKNEGNGDISKPNLNKYQESAKSIDPSSKYTPATSGSFIYHVFKESGNEEFFPKGLTSIDSKSIHTHVKNSNKGVASNYRPGDIVFIPTVLENDSPNSTGDMQTYRPVIITEIQNGVVTVIEGNVKYDGKIDSAINEYDGTVEVVKNYYELSTIVRDGFGYLAFRSSGDFTVPVEDNIDSNTEVPPVESTRNNQQEAGDSYLLGNAENVLNLSTQPMMTFVDIYLGDHKVTLLPPSTLISFEFNKSASDMGNSFTLTLFDKNWGDLEQLCSVYFDRMKFRYGYVTGKQSPIYEARLIDYDVEFNNSGTILYIRGITTGATNNLQNITLNTDTTSPSEAAKKIAKAAGWVVRDENFHPTVPVPFKNRDSISLINDRPATFIVNELNPIAIRASDGKSGYRFYLDERERPPVAYFKPFDVDNEHIRTYIYMRGVDSPVKDLRLSINGVFGGATLGQAVATSLTSSTIDPDTKDINTVTEDLNTVRIDVTGEYSHTHSKQYTSVVDSPALAPEHSRSILRYNLTAKGNTVYEGTMTIVGDPSLKLTTTPEENIRLMILTDKGILHHSSGVYQVLNIIDSIDSGIMSTAMTIFRTGDIEHGVELVRYNRLMK